MQKFKTLLQKFVAAEDGQGMVEYSLILALVSVAAIGTLTALGGGINSIFTSASTALKPGP